MLYDKTHPRLVWAVLIVFFCAAIFVASVPPADAQGLASNADTRRYTSYIQSVFEFVQNHFVDSVDAQKLYEGAMNGMMAALGDPYSVFLAEKDMADLNQNVIQGNYGGVGLYISKPVESAEDNPAYVEIAAPIEDTPGWKAGLQPGDLIIEIEGESTETLSMDDVLARLKGPVGENVGILVRRGKFLTFPVTLTRAVIEVPTVKQAIIGGDVGYLKLLSFSSMTANRAREVIAGFKKANYKALILDLRNNYGGRLDAAVDVCEFFLDSGPVVSVKSRIPGQSRDYNARSAALVPKDMPIVVLINRGSASASEIVAGALKDRSRAFLVGEKSFGKGSVQQVYPLERTGAGFKLTTARYYTPSDVNIDKVGIPPDREVLFPAISAEESEKLVALIKARAIPLFVEEHPDAAKEETQAFSQRIQAEYTLPSPLVDRLIRDEQNRTVISPVYDLEYDVQLQEAMKVLREENFLHLIQNTKTLRALQEESAVVEQALATPPGN
ncbi:MAG: S41 family peptidase [Spirochaetaceae bacterium]|jgi:carboxyl-terminal processing protease|nr:S41 family peptidase [Spirochaetaceae bacterium]